MNTTMAVLAIDVADLVGHPERRRELTGDHEVALRLGGSTVEGPMHVECLVAGTTDGVQADFTVTAPARLQCVRCLVAWDDDIEVGGSQHYSLVPDEDGYGIVDRSIDVMGPAQDELALSIPLAPLCRPDCRGLCPICGTDLNSDPCDGHKEDSDSPFAVLKDLFDS